MICVAKIVLQLVVSDEYKPGTFLAIECAKKYSDCHRNYQYPIPFIFGVLTTNNTEQARECAGGKHGNKGVESAITTIRMIALKRKFADPLQS